MLPALFQVNNHHFEVIRKFTSLLLIVDGTIVQRRDGLFNQRLTSSEFVWNSTESGKTVCYLFKTKIGIILDKVTLYQDGKEIDTKRFV